MPKRKPKFLKGSDDDSKKPDVQPKKFATFSHADSHALEAAYQKKLEEMEMGKAAGNVAGSARAGSKRPRVVSSGDVGSDGEDGEGSLQGTKVPVNEDFLFDVDIEERELGPAYWEGPIYEVRRGSWFYQEGSALRPCEENLAAQLEEGYLRVKPWTYPPRVRSNSGTRTVTPKSSFDNLRATAASQSENLVVKASSPVSQHQPQTYRLFGAHINSVATYQDASVAWLSSDGVLSWVTSTVYERFAGGGYMSGVKLARGYTEPKKVKDDKRPMTPIGTQFSPVEQDEKLQKALKRRSAPPSTKPVTEIDDDTTKDGQVAEIESATSRLTRQLSNMLEGAENQEGEDEAIRRQEEQEMLDDYNARLGESQGREIEHVILVTHGIGQLLGLKCVIATML